MLYTYKNPDKEETTAIKKALAQNGGYCPCRIVHNEETKCLCLEFRQQDHEGYCKCGLYYKTATKEERNRGRERGDSGGCATD